MWHFSKSYNVFSIRNENSHTPHTIHLCATSPIQHATTDFFVTQLTRARLGHI